MPEQWIIAMAVLLTLFHPGLASSNYYLDKGSKRQIKRVDENATAFVSCPELAEDEKLNPSIPISLHKGATKLHSTDMINNIHQSWQKFQVSTQNSSVSYKIVRTDANDTGLYCCTIHTDMRTSQTILLVKDAQQPTEPSLPCPTAQTLPFIGIGFIILYNLLMTFFSCYLACKLKKTELPENPYMNTRPGEFRRC